MAAVSKNIKRIKDTLANIIAGLADGKSALLTDQKNEHIHRVGSDFFFPAMSKKTANGSSYTYIDSEFKDLGVHGAFTVDGASTLSGSTSIVGDLSCTQNLSVGEDAGITGDLTVSGKIINNSTRYQYNFDLDGASKSWTLFTLSQGTEFRKEIFVAGNYYGPPAHVNSRFDYTEFKAYIKDGGLGTGVIVKTFEDFTLPDDPYVPSVRYTITLDGLDVILTATGIATDDILDLYIQVK